MRERSRDREHAETRRERHAGRTDRPGRHARVRSAPREPSGRDEERDRTVERHAPGNGHDPVLVDLSHDQPETCRASGRVPERCRRVVVERGEAARRKPCVQMRDSGRESSSGARPRTHPAPPPSPSP